MAQVPTAARLNAAKQTAIRMQPRQQAKHCEKAFSSSDSSHHLVRACNRHESKHPALAKDVRAEPKRKHRSVRLWLSFKSQQCACKYHANTQHALRLVHQFSGCCPPEKGSRGADVVLSVRGAGKAHTGQVNVCHLVPGLDAVRCCVSCPGGRSPRSLATMTTSPISFH